MYLARNKNGHIGRQVPAHGMRAKVESPTMGERRGDVFVSTHSIQADQEYYSALENEQRALAQAKRIQNLVKRRADEIRQRERIKAQNDFDRAAAFDPMNEKLKHHYARKAGMGESQAVIESISNPYFNYGFTPSGQQLIEATNIYAQGGTNPADFSSTGANPQIVDSEFGKRPIAWDADFRQHLIVGNPLTRNGEYGPAVTDYDRFVNGVDVNQTNIVEMPIAGGTMLGRWNGGVAPAGNGGQHFRRTASAGMGFDFSWGGITDAISNVANQTVDNLQNSLPEQLAKELQEAITGGGQVTNQSGGNITIQRPVTGTTTTVAQTLGLPTWALYAGLGLIGIGVTFMMIKAVKS